jgi:endonuclease/exonuclease/phosphatase family metal-dependent hydrolase
MVTGSTTFPHKNVHLATLRTPDGKTESQIDHILIEARHETSMMDVRSYRGTHMESDHCLVVTRIRVPIKITKYSRSKKNLRYIINGL